MLKVLVVCTANQCRSPLVAALLRRRSAELGLRVGVASAGVSATDGAPPSSGSVREAEGRGVDLADHRAQSLDPELVLEAHVIVAMEVAHVEHLAGRFPGSLNETFTLVELAEMGSQVPPLPGEGAQRWLDRAGRERSLRSLRRRGLDVDDPIGGTDRDYREMADRVEELLAAWLKDLAIATQSE